LSSRVTLATNGKGAFRVEVAGTRPDDVTRLMLTGQGDEHEIELPAGPYTANVTNIGTGEQQSFEFQVGETEHLLNIGGDRSRRANWRSVSEREGAPKGWKAAGMEEAASGNGQASSLPVLQTHTSLGWRPFSGTVMVNDALPNAWKVVRSKTWSETPLLRVEFAGIDGRPAHSFVPLFSGGTLVLWHGDDRRVIEIKPCEPKSAAIVGSLTNSIREELPKILQWAAGSDEVEAVQSIMNSRDDPWIAAATGLLLLGSARLKQNGSSLSRVAARNPWIADLGVLAAWGRAVDTPDDEAACLDLLTQARVGGTVYFWQTCSIADRLLTALASNSRSTAVGSRGRKEHDRWKRLRADAFKVGALLGWPASTQRAR
jgi:hypothetical protein